MAVKKQEKKGGEVEPQIQPEQKKLKYHCTTCKKDSATNICPSCKVKLTPYR